MEHNQNIFQSARVEKLGALFLLVATLLVGAQAAHSIVAFFDGSGDMPQNVITVEGVGTVTAVPDVARITYTFSETADAAAAAQEQAARKSNAALALLRDDFGIEDKDIKTTSYNISPKYNRPQPCFNGFCPEYEQTIVGYTVSQSVEVKVRDTGKAGDVLSALGAAGIKSVYGPSFTIDDPDALKGEARSKAIAMAREKADMLAKELDVRLVRVVNFWENSGGLPYTERAYGLGAGAAYGGDVAAAPDLPTGENEVTSQVSITYEIR